MQCGIGCCVPLDMLFNLLQAFHFKIDWEFPINPSRTDPGRREKINITFYFHTSLRCLKRFNKALKAFIKPFEAPQRSVKIKINLIYFNTTFRNARDIN